ncbi:uncharacterized protein LOC122498936 [Leptopilina heterotoma]|uniref:uncharacterized protein LOC122498936 n=1 Tax=Leptopilina heterotoma TaxID=63436 RepID=UPI001CA86937|nr:uncharacterized protein LOC122498936 [Leptopilina heterotoma]
MENLKREAEMHPECPPEQIVRENLCDLSPAVLAQLPERENLKKTMRRERRRKLPPNPKSLEDLNELPESYKKTFSNERFLMYDSRDDIAFGEGRVLVFSTRNNLERLADSDTWYVDGTFKVSPSLFTQLFTVMGKVLKPNVRGNEPTVIAFPFVYALLSSKETDQYEAVFRSIASMAATYGIHHCRPQRIVSDFEVAIINACCSVYPNIPLSCCFFHLGQSL